MFVEYLRVFSIRYRCSGVGAAVLDKVRVFWIGCGCSF